ncbi:MAG: Crp/Fnr family transcriptional regulator [Desulfobacterales bacterium]|nr:Crp/Fnr family transcriptional regulator [Desulfobacterales bacterium]
MIESAKMSLTDLLKKKVFQNNSDENKGLKELTNLFKIKNYSRKELLVLAGERWKNVYFINNGSIRLFYTDIEGREFNKGFFSEGDLVWPVAPSARKKESLFSIAALEDTIVSQCKFCDFYSLLMKLNLWEKFALPYAEKFSEDKFQREYEFLMLSATERYKKFCKDHPKLKDRIPDYQLATYLGITNVSLSRIKNR